MVLHIHTMNLWLKVESFIFLDSPLDTAYIYIPNQAFFIQERKLNALN